MSLIRKMAAFLLLVVVAMPSLSVPALSEEGAEPSCIAPRAGTLTVPDGQEYLVSGSVSYDYVICAGLLTVPEGASLTAFDIQLAATAALEVSGGNLTVLNISGQSRLSGSCRHLNLTKNANLTVAAAPGIHSIAASNGLESVFDVAVITSCTITNSTLNVTGGNGYDLAVADGPWQTGGVLDGRFAAGGNASFTLTCKGELHIANSTVAACAGRGGRAADGLTATTMTGVKGGGYVNKGDVRGLVGIGGNVTMGINATGFFMRASEMLCIGGKGGNAGKSGKGGNGTNGGGVGGNGAGGGGGGGYSSGDGGNGAFGNSADYGNPGFAGGPAGNVGGRVGCGGTSVMDVIAGTLDVDLSNITCRGGAGGDGGNSSWMAYGGTAGQCAGGGGGGAGGGAYSSGGGGGGGGGANDVYEIGMGGNPGAGGICGTVADTVGCGGDASLKLEGFGSVSRNSNVSCNGGLRGNGAKKEGNGASSGDGKYGGGGGLGGWGRGCNNANGTSLCSIPMFTPILLLPVNGSHTNLDPPTLVWTPQHNSTTNGNLTGYTLQFSSLSDFGTLEYTCVTANSQHKPDVIFPAARYYWRVNALYENPPSSSPGWSEVWNIDLNLPPEALLIPDNHSFAEDTTADHLIDLQDYFLDDTVSGGMANYSVVYMEDPARMNASVDGRFLNFTSPTPDWYGSCNFSVRATDRFGLGNVSNDFRVTVRPVNDPPRFRTIPSLYVTEDEPFSFNLMPYVYDVDNLTREISLQGTCNGNLSLTGFDLSLLYIVDASSDSLHLVATDGLDPNSTDLNVIINSTNDRPVVSTVESDRYKVYRVQSALITVKGSDEEDQPEALACQVQFRYLSSSWENLTVNYMANSGSWEAMFSPQRTWSVGNYSIRARLLDKGGAASDWSSPQKDIMVLNNVPFVNDFVLPLKAMNRTQTIQMTFTGGDMEDGPAGITIEAHFKAPTGGWKDEFTAAEIHCDMSMAFNGTGAGVWSLTPFKSTECGNFSFRIRAVDRQGVACEWLYFNDSLLVQNNLPFVLPLELTPAVVDRGAEVRVKIAASDIEDVRDTLVCELEYRAPGANWTPIKYLTPSGTGWEATITTSTGWGTGECQVRARVTDMDGALSAWSVGAFSVRDLPPKVNGIQPGVNPVTAGKNATATVLASDPDTPLSGLRAEMEFKIGNDWKSAGTGTQTADGWSYSFTVPANTEGLCDLRARVRDGSGNWTAWYYVNGTVRIVKPGTPPGPGPGGDGGILGFSPTCVIGGVIGLVVVVAIIAVVMGRGSARPPQRPIQQRRPSPRGPPQRRPPQRPPPDNDGGLADREEPPGSHEREYSPQMRDRTPPPEMYENDEPPARSGRDEFPSDSKKRSFDDLLEDGGGPQ